MTDDLLHAHTFNAVRGRCHCGTKLTSGQFSRHLVEVTLEAAMLRQKGAADSEIGAAYEEGYQDGRGAGPA